MIPLSSAILRGTTVPAYPGVFGMAYVGSLRWPEVEPFQTFLCAASYESLCDCIHAGLMHRFPHLGCSVRDAKFLDRDGRPCFRSGLAEELEKMGVLVRVKPFQKQYRPEIHKSLWAVIVQLEDQESATDIAKLLERYGL